MKRVPELDGLRGLAAIAIVAFHYGEHTPIHDRLLYAGVTSLELFFVLSGYLISTIILNHAGEPGFFRTFYIRRGLRIWPIYYLLLLVYASTWLFMPRQAPLSALPYALMFTQNIEFYWFAKPVPLAYPLTPTWSLAVEEQFYILWPLLVGLFGTRRLGAIAVGCVATSVAARFAGFHPWILLARSDGFAIGGLLALAVAAVRDGRTVAGDLARGLTILGGACLFYLAVGLPMRGLRPFEMTFATDAALDRTVLAGFFACLIGLVVVHAGRPVLAPLRSRWLVYLGTISYGVYLYHMSAYMALELVMKRLGLPPALAFGLLAPALCLAVSAASWAWIEKPALRLKDRFGYRRAEAIARPVPRDEPAPAIRGGRRVGVEPGAVVA